MAPRVYGSPGHFVVADAKRTIADKLGEKPDTIQAAYWLKVQNLSPWKNENRMPSQVSLRRP